MSDDCKADQAWAVRGIPEEIRRAVLERARAEGRTVGAWVTQALRSALAVDDLSQQVDRLKARVDLLETRMAEREAR